MDKPYLFKKAAERLVRTQQLGLRRPPPARPTDEAGRPLTLPTGQGAGSQGPADPGLGAPLPPAQHPPIIDQAPYREHPDRRPSSPVSTGFGLGLGFAAGTAIFRGILFLIGAVMVMVAIAAVFSALGIPLL